VVLYVGRVSREKSVDLLPPMLRRLRSSGLPCRLVVAGDGPYRRELADSCPEAICTGTLGRAAVAEAFASADVFVFPSRTDTYGVVQLEALACGVPVAAFPVTGPKDVIGNNAIGALNEDLRVACLEALQMSRETCRAFALTRSWETSARQFIDHANQVAVARSRKRHATLPVQAPAQG
jgi:glycosyltransferase involved in cell wall biosynthesis